MLDNPSPCVSFHFSPRLRLRRDGIPVRQTIQISQPGAGGRDLVGGSIQFSYPTLLFQLQEFSLA